MRQLARLLQTLRKENEAANFDDFIDTARFDELVAAVKDLCGFKEESRLEIDVPSLAIKLGHSIKQCAQVLKSSALRKKDEAAIRECQNFIEHAVDRKKTTSYSQVKQVRFCKSYQRLFGSSSWLGLRLSQR